MTNRPLNLDGAGPPNSNVVTGVILAGGRATRMGTVDKGLQLLHGTPLAAHALQRLQRQVIDTMFNANQNQATYAALGAPVVGDTTGGFQGPLAGLETGMMHCRTPYLVSVPCDAPFLPLDLVQRLLTALLRERTQLAIAVTGRGLDEQTHPVFCLAHVSLLPHLSAFLKKGERKFESWAKSLRATRVLFDDESAFVNINSMEALTQFERSNALHQNQGRP